MSEPWPIRKPQELHDETECRDSYNCIFCALVRVVRELEERIYDLEGRLDPQ